MALPVVAAIGSLIFYALVRVLVGWGIPLAVAAMLFFIDGLGEVIVFALFSGVFQLLEFAFASASIVVPTFPGWSGLNENLLKGLHVIEFWDHATVVVGAIIARVGVRIITLGRW